MLKNKGQISVLVASITAGGMLFASIVASWATADSRVAEIDKKVSIVEERENNHYNEVSKKLDYIINKLDKQ